MTERPPLLDAIGVRPLVLDAAMGTRLAALGLDLRHDDPSHWNLARPDDVASIHAADVVAGAEVLLTNTFGANRHWLERFGLGSETTRINQAAVSIARSVGGEEHYVLGSIGPSAEGSTSCADQAVTLAESGVDALLFETHTFDQAVRSLRAVRPIVRIPLFVSLTRWPDPIGDVTARLEDEGASVLGSNCERGMARILETARRLARVTSLPLLVEPSASLPGEVPEHPESFRALVPALLTVGVRLIGGCCGTTDAHVAAIRAGCYDALGSVESM
jgi:methionine synthase I (cobalamin-dependent)